jgi:hypothetical protein
MFGTKKITKMISNFKGKGPGSLDLNFQQVSKNFSKAQVFVALTFAVSVTT